MPEHVRVRLVPKTREGESITMTLSEITPQLAKQFAPDPGRASEALRPAINLGMEAKIDGIARDGPQDHGSQARGIGLIAQGQE